MEFYEPENFDNLQGVEIGRKGLPKYFDMQLAYISKLQRDSEESLDEFDKNVKRFIMGPV